MKTVPVRVAFTVVLGTFVATFSLHTARPSTALPLQTQVPGAPGVLPDAPGKEVVARVCIVCHGLDYLVPSDRTASQWRDTLANMKQAGALASDEEWKMMTEYVMANIAYLNMNKATAEEIRLVFAVGEKLAQGVVAYRDKQGGFKTLEDLKQAPELDPKKIDALKTRLIF
jgi:competence protein ComEA